MGTEFIEQLANEIREIYNPKDLSPFPFDNFIKDKKDLELVFLSDLPVENVSGLITYNEEKEFFTIIINKKKPVVRQYFSIAHEIGHYVLHNDYLRQEKLIIEREYSLYGNKILFRKDDLAQVEQYETEANNFAAFLIMPSDLVTEAWESLRSVEKCAEIFHVSVSAMSIRLERLGIFIG